MKKKNQKWTPGLDGDTAGNSDPWEPVALSVSQVARYLGLSRAMVYKAAARGQIPSIQIGKRVLILIDALYERYPLLAETAKPRIIAHSGSNLKGDESDSEVCEKNFCSYPFLAESEQSTLSSIVPDRTAGTTEDKDSSPMEDSNKVWTPKAISKITGLSEPVIRSMAQRGKIKTITPPEAADARGNRYLFSNAEVARVFGPVARASAKAEADRG